MYKRKVVCSSRDWLTFAILRSPVKRVTDLKRVFIAKIQKVLGNCILQKIWDINFDHNLLELASDLRKYNWHWVKCLDLFYWKSKFGLDKIICLFYVTKMLIITDFKNINENLWVLFTMTLEHSKKKLGTCVLTITAAKSHTTAIKCLCFMTQN